MGIFTRKKEIEELREQINKLTEERARIGGLFFNSSSGYSSESAMKLSAVYCATNLISNTIASLPIQVIMNKGGRRYVDNENGLTFILNKQPDGVHTHFMFIKQLIESVILKGAGYAYVERDSKLNVKRVLYINPDFVTPMKQTDGRMKYIVTGFKGAVDQDSMIDLHMHVDEQGYGISLISYAAKVLGLAYDEQDSAEKFFSNGGSLAGILKPGNPINKEQRREAAEAWRESFNNAGTKVPVVILPYGLSYEPISVNPRDAQLLESREFSILEIARFFNIDPSKLYYMTTKVDAANEQEALQNLFYSDCLLPYITALCEELSRKILLPSQQHEYEIDMDFSAVMRTDMNSQASYFRSLITNGLCTVNEARAKIGFSPLDGDEYDTCYMQLSYAKLGSIYDGSYIKQNAQDPSSNTKVDNKVKEKDE